MFEEPNIKDLGENKINFYLAQKAFFLNSYKDQNFDRI